MESVHKAVLLHEVVESLVSSKISFGGGRSFASFADDFPPRALNHSAPLRLVLGSVGSVAKLPPNEIWYLDGTLGGSGHALAIAKALKGKINIIGLDRDAKAIERAKKMFGEVRGKIGRDAGVVAKSEKVILENENYRNLDKVLEKNSVGTVEMILLDLGLSSDELEKSGRGFSFQKDEPLLMTMGDPASYPFTAKDILNRWAEEDIANVLYGYGEERFARRIARAVVGYRERKTIETSGEFSEIIRTSVPAFYRRGKIHPATRSFQALRIAVNDELGALREGLEKGYKHLASGGKMAVISFHSLEDAIVKNYFREKAKEDGAVITKKPITAGPQEVAENPRSRSAKLRVIQKI